MSDISKVSHTEPSTEHDFGDLDAIIQDFEHAWNTGKAPDIADYLPHPTSEMSAENNRMQLLYELMKIDLEYRWKSASSPDDLLSEKGRILEDYCREFSELERDNTLPLDLIGEEYRVRKRWGDKLELSEYKSRFPEQGSRLKLLFEQIDCELFAEDNVHSWSDFPSVDHTNFTLSSGPDPRAPLPFSDYLLHKHLGTGGMGKVYRAFQKSLGRQVAVKYLKKVFINNQEAVDRFITEARVIAQLNHPGIIAVQGLGRTPAGGYFIVMDFVQGGNLEQEIRSGPIKVSQAVQWIVEAAQAIDHAHQNKIIHCDLKPGNLLLGDDKQVVVTDFGLAQSLAEGTQLIPGPAGTAGYMAPEQIDSCWEAVGPHTDVYGLGAVLYAMLTGRAPYTGKRIADILAEVVSGKQPLEPHTFQPDVPEAISSICMKCLSQRPNQRFASAEELATVLLAKKI